MVSLMAVLIWWRVAGPSLGGVLVAVFLDDVLEERLAGDAFDAVQSSEWLGPYGHLGAVLRLGACYGMVFGEGVAFLGVGRVGGCG